MNKYHEKLLYFIWLALLVLLVQMFIIQTSYAMTCTENDGRTICTGGGNTATCTTNGNRTVCTEG